MIKTQTVFILGAGASVPYKFPTGDGLKDLICQNFVNEYRHFPFLSDLPGQLLALENRKRIKFSEDFTTALRKATGQSIDLFLSISESHLTVGKIAILHSILKSENQSQFRLKEDDWYTYLFERMMQECWKQKKPELFTDNNVKFITFNYDRSLEHFIAESFVNNFSDLQKEVKLLDYVNNFPIHHVYGSVGLLPSQTNSNTDNIVAYGNIDKRYIQTEPALKSIKLIDKRSDIDSEKIAEILSDADRLFILGFGFLKENMDVLQLHKYLPTNYRTPIYATTKGMHPKRVEEISKYFSSMKRTPSFMPESITCYEMVYKHLWE